MRHQPASKSTRFFRSTASACLLALLAGGCSTPGEVSVPGQASDEDEPKFATIAFDDRHWHAFDDAGDVAYERGNYKYAARMYGEALQIARELEDAQLVTASLQALSRANAAHGRSR